MIKKSSKEDISKLYIISKERLRLELARVELKLRLDGKVRVERSRSKEPSSGRLDNSQRNNHDNKSYQHQLKQSDNSDETKQDLNIKQHHVIANIHIICNSHKFKPYILQIWRSDKSSSSSPSSTSDKPRRFKWQRRQRRRSNFFKRCQA